jgi:hypothetical protein
MAAGLAPVGHCPGGRLQTLANDTAAIKRIYVLTPYASLQQFGRTVQQLQNDATLETTGACLC